MNFLRIYLAFKYGVRLNKPIVIIRLIKNYFKILVFKKKLLRYADIAVDYKCNLKCMHCSAMVLEKKELETLTVTEYRKFFNECSKLGLIFIGFTGGEPFLHPNLIEIIKSSNPKSFLISIQTNGTLITDSLVKKIKEIGVDCLTVSMDSFFEKEHDLFRGKEGSFRSAMEGIEIALKNKMRVAINVTIGHGNIRSPSFFHLIHWTKKNKLPLLISIAMPAGKWQDKLDYLLTTEDTHFLREEILKRHHNVMIDYRLNYIFRGCGAAKEKLYITPYGDLMPCPFLHFSFGNVKHESVKKIRERMLNTPELHNYNDRCLSGEDRNFINKYISKTFGKTELPLYYKEVFTT